MVVEVWPGRCAQVILGMCSGVDSLCTGVGEGKECAQGVTGVSPGCNRSVPRGNSSMKHEAVHHSCCIPFYPTYLQGQGHCRVTAGYLILEYRDIVQFILKYRRNLPTWHIVGILFTND